MKFWIAAVAVVVCAFAIGSTSIMAAALDCNTTSAVPRPIQLGVSGGNINAFGKMGQQIVCFSGTLGSMVQDSSSNKFILSNNHVLADLNTAQPGEEIVQPGLADVQCMQSSFDAVATFTRTVNISFGKAKNTIDAAIAAVVPDQVSPNILNIGGIDSTTARAKPGLAVQKMGRSSCLTTGSIKSTGVNADITYQLPDGSQKTAKFINQILIQTKGFFSPGDSGALILTRAACPQAVGLLFAGAQTKKHTFTLANPISNVLSGLGVSMVGTCGPPATGTPQAVEEAQNATMSDVDVESAKAIRDRHEDKLMKIPGAVGTGVGMGDRGHPAIEVYVKKMTPEAQAAAPKEVQGMPVKLIESGGFVAY